MKSKVGHVMALMLNVVLAAGAIGCDSESTQAKVERWNHASVRLRDAGNYEEAANAAMSALVVGCPSLGMDSVSCGVAFFNAGLNGASLDQPALDDADCLLKVARDVLCAHPEARAECERARVEHGKVLSMRSQRPAVRECTAESEVKMWRTERQRVR